jgi:protein TonB
MDLAALTESRSGRDSGETPGAILGASSPLAVSEVDQLPELTAKLEPQYPEHLREGGVSGEVQLEYIIQSTGRVEPTSIRIIASDHQAFSQSVVEAVLQARFTPARRTGQPVAVLVRQTIRFQNR